MAYLIKGVLIGIVFGVPVGAIGVLTIRRCIQYGTTAGLASGIGCSAADLVYSCISVFGVTLISDFMLRYQNVISLVGSVLIILIGIGTVLKKQTQMSEAASTGKLASFFTSSFLIAITNPATIITFVFAFSIFNIADIPSIIAGIVLVTGLFAGTCCWWLCLTFLIRIFRAKITEGWLGKINYILGSLIILFGAAIALRIFL